MLNPDNDLHLFILHYIFLPRINHAIESFVDSWNAHPIRTEKNWSPTLLWTNGMVDSRNSNIRHIAEMQNLSEETNIDDLQWYGMDWGAPTPADDGLSIVEVNTIESPLDDDLDRMIRQVEPLSESSCYGIDLYLQVLDLLSDGNNTSNG